MRTVQTYGRTTRKRVLAVSLNSLPPRGRSRLHDGRARSQPCTRWRRPPGRRAACRPCFDLIERRQKWSMPAGVRVCRFPTSRQEAFWIGARCGSTRRVLLSSIRAAFGLQRHKASFARERRLDAIKLGSTCARGCVASAPHARGSLRPRRMKRRAT